MRFRRLLGPLAVFALVAMLLGAADAEAKPSRKRRKAAARRPTARPKARPRPRPPGPQVAPMSTEPLAPLDPNLLRPYTGLGTWVDVYDWSDSFTRSDTPAVDVNDVDRMHASGVQTIYIQTAKWQKSADVLEPELLFPIIERAHALGMDVVGWYLPTLRNVNVDLRKLVAMTAYGVDGVAVDIEARFVSNFASRNRRLVELSRRLRESVPNLALGAIVLPPVVTEDVNPHYWPAFPYADLAPYYDIWMPMGYWTDRKPPWRGAYRSTRTNIERIRHHLGRADALVHPIGGIADKTNEGDIRAFVGAVRDTGSIGGSLYDWNTSRSRHWPSQQVLRRAGSRPIDATTTSTSSTTTTTPEPEPTPTTSTTSTTSLLSGTAPARTRRQGP